MHIFETYKSQYHIHIFCYESNGKKISSFILLDTGYRYCNQNIITEETFKKRCACGFTPCITLRLMKTLERFQFCYNLLQKVIPVVTHLLIHCLQTKLASITQNKNTSNNNIYLERDRKSSCKSCIVHLRASTAFILLKIF